MRIIVLLFLSLVILVTSALATSKLVKSSHAGIVERQVLSLNTTREDFVTVPVLVSNESLPTFSAQAILAIDIDSQAPLYEKNPDLPLLPASTTKIITALVAIDYFSTQSVLTANNVQDGGTSMGLVEGEQITVDSLLRGLLISSANDAAEVLADNYPGGRPVFISAMNEKARNLHLDNSVFKNPTGFEDYGHISTAHDLIRASEIAMGNPYFAEIVRTKETVVTSVDGKIIHKLENINELLGKVDGVQGVKTGWTENARENLVTYIVRDGHRVMIALLGSQDRFGETEELIGWIFKSYSWKEVALKN